MNKIDEFFKNEFTGYRESPSSHLWANIETRLDKQELSRSKKRYLFLFMTTTILLILVSSALVFTIYQHHRTGITNQHTIISQTKSVPAGSISQNILKLEIPFRSGNKQIAPRRLYSSLIDIVILPDSQLLPAYSKPEFNPPYPQNFDHFSPKMADNLSPYKFSPTLSFPKKNKTVSRFSLAPIFSADMFRNRMSEIYDFENDDLEDYRDREHNDLSFTAGLLVNRQLTKKWSLESGLLISNTYSSIQPFTVKTVKDEAGNYNFTMASSIGFVKVLNAAVQNPGASDSIMLQKESIQHLQYVTVPLSVKYRLLSRNRISVSLSSGIAANILTKGEIEVTAPGTTAGEELTMVNKIQGLRKNFISVLLGGGINYQLSRHFSAGLSPRLRFAITPINKQTPVRSYPSSLSLETGLAYSF